MSYSKDLELFPNIIREQIARGKQVKLLAKHNETLYEVCEHIAMVENIEDYAVGQLATLKIRFANNVVVETKAYLDGTVKEGDYIAILGIYVDTEQGPRYFVKGGLCRIITRATDLSMFNFEKAYKMGIIIGLTTLKFSNIYKASSNIYPLGRTKIFYSIEDMGNEVSTGTTKEVSTTGLIKVFNTKNFATNMQEEQENR